MDIVKTLPRHIKGCLKGEDVTAGTGGCKLVSTGTVITDRPISKIVARENGAVVNYAYRGVWRELPDNNTATGGSTTTIIFPDDYSEYDNAYTGMYVYIKSGTGVGQVLLITAYNGTTKTATFSTATAPDNTSVFRILEGEDMSVASKGNFAATALISGDVISPFRVPYELVSVNAASGSVWLYIAN